MASVFLVREYDYELQEVLCVASEARYAQMFVGDVRTAPCAHPVEFHTEDWPVSDCVEQAVASADRLLIEEWTTGTTEPRRSCCSHLGCDFTVSLQSDPAIEELYRHSHSAHADIEA